jgi:transporter family protein
MELYIFFAVISMTFFGINGVLIKVAPEIDPFSLTLVSFSSSTVVAFLYWLICVPDKQVSMQGVGYGVLSGLVSFTALIAFMIGIRMGNASTVSTISSLSSAITVILAVLILSEKITLTQGIGIIIAIISVFLLSWR